MTETMPKKTTPKNTSENMPTDMNEIRVEIDRVDTALLDLIAERMELAQAVRRAKSGVDVWRPSREESHVRHLAALAGATPPHLVSRIWAELTSASLALQGPIQLHISLEGDALSSWQMVRDRFGASIPAHTYLTASAALAAAQADTEGVAVLSAPGGMNNWWTALGPDGAMSNMNILAALPRVGEWQWPKAVAVSKARREPSGDDITLVYVEEELDPSTGAVLRAQVENRYLYSVSGYSQTGSPQMQALVSQPGPIKVIGVLPSPIALPR